MTDRVAKLLDQILALPREERELLIEALYQHSQETIELDDALRTELARRVRSVEDGTAVLLDGDAVMDELARKYRK